jgi:hypothetical protein
MNPVSYEQIMSLLGLIALWAFWYYLWKPQRVDIFRQKLFALRSDLFDLAATGLVAFDDPAYSQLRLLINGLIRFSHRISFASLLIAVAHSRQAPSDPLAAWKKNVAKLPEDARNQLLAVHSSVQVAFAKHLTFGSALLLAYVVLRVSFAVARALFLLLTGKKRLSYFTVSQARCKMEMETKQVARAGADVIEARVLQEEQRRTGFKGRAAFAH